MRIEVKHAVDFLIDLLRLNSAGLTDDQLVKFKDVVCQILMRHYADHWFPDRPFKGSGYRCIRINGHLDPLIARAGFVMGIASCFLRSLFPSELTMWVDPMEVAYRIGENGSICVLYEEMPPSPPPTPEVKTPVKITSPPPPTQPLRHSPPHHQVHHHHYNHHHFSPSKSVVVSPPLSPVTTQQQQQAAAATAMQLSMFFMGGGGGGGLAKEPQQALAKCKESLRGGLDARPLPMERLFVSS
ncbi:Protein BTG1 [Chionoecetes opilio]|uniref:Protein BTG1 n=1 Tax=Chionoecetes opilio TaxID=41210 RepID=A0A8J4Y9C5_CHIOP|nr:Protein BTG1 [Chionoecetes opilio]